MSTGDIYGAPGNNAVDYARIPRRLYRGLLGNSSTLLYTAPVAPTSGPPPKVIITEIIIANADTGALAVTLKFGGDAAANVVIPAVSYAANSHVREEMCTVLEAGETIYGFAGTANKVVVEISGIEYLVLPAA